MLLSGQANRDRPLLLAVAITALAAGLLIYAVDRDWATVAFLSPFADLQTEPQQWFGAAGKFLPSFLHACAICLLLILALEPRRSGSLLVCATWCVTALALEVIQLDRVYASLFAPLQAQAATGLLDPVESYARLGVFDPADMIATTLGCIAALVISQINGRSP
jgi:hypothetical protein